jgi:hypothetical protein
MRLALILALVPALALAEPRQDAPTTVSVPVVLDAQHAAILSAWCDTVAAREGRAVTPQEQARVFVVEALARIHAASVQAEAQRQAAAALTPATRAYHRRVAEEARKALAAQTERKQP